MSILEDEKRGEREKGEKYRAKVEDDGIRIDRIHCGEILCISKRFDWARINFPKEGEREMIPPRIRLESFPFDILSVFAQPGGERKNERKKKKKKNQRQFALESGWPVSLGMITTLRSSLEEDEQRPLLARFIREAPCKRHFPSEFPLPNNVLIICPFVTSCPNLLP